MTEPFAVGVPQEDLDDLRDRLRRTRWPEPDPSGGWAAGVPLPWLQDLCAAWAEHDWRATEERLNALPHVRTTIDGLAVHAVHVRSGRPDAMPLVLTHGWPGSFLEFEALIPLLRDDFHLVLPSLPGYGFSGRPAEPGWGVRRIADAWAELMARLGYHRFGAAGSDWGTSVATLLGQRHPDRITGLHLVPPLAAPDGSEPDGAERAALADLERRRRTESGYSAVQATKPQTIGYALLDSPAALAAWLGEKYVTWADHDGDLFDAVPRAALLDTLSLYWLTGTGASAARLYRESIEEVSSWFTDADPEPVRVPVGATVFPREVPRPSRRWAERRFPDLRYWSTPARGGHFGGLEQPHVLAADLRAFFALLPYPAASTGG
jgi:pimeloyl-ACP methyl ester carboxylesterase